jgi:nucleoside-diphosphate-sugar epimerase
MIKILVFGSTGFIGRNILDSFSKDKNLILFTPSKEECSLIDYIEVKKYINKVNPDFIINAAYIGVSSNIKISKIYSSKNLNISKNILRGSMGNKRIKRIIYFGSGLEYGDAKIAINEIFPLNPKNFYARIKANASNSSIALANKIKVPLVIIKPFNLYGPYDNKSVIFYLIESIIKNKKIVLTKGEQIRDYLYVVDLVELLRKIINNYAIAEGNFILNVGSGVGIPLNKIFIKIFELMDSKLEYKTRAYRRNDYFNQVADISKVKKLFVWSPSTPLEFGLSKTIKWIRSIEV